MTTQTRVPTADGYVQWLRSFEYETSNYGNVNEYPSIDDDHYNYDAIMLEQDYFTFAPFSVPAGATIQSVKIYVRGKCQYDQDLIGCNLGFHGTQLYGKSDNFGTSFEEKVFTWTDNPRTALPWTVDCVNGVGSEYLEVFGYIVLGMDDLGNRYVSRIYIEVAYTEHRTTAPLPLFYRS
jgi:hypothetical protein